MRKVFHSGYGWRLGDFSDLQDGLVLPVTADFANTFLGFVTDGGDLVGLDVGLDDFGGDFGLGYGGRAYLDGLAVDDQQRLKAGALAGVLEKFDLNGVALGDQVLLSTGIDDCFFHTFIGAYQKSPPL